MHIAASVISVNTVTAGQPAGCGITVTDQRHPGIPTGQQAIGQIVGVGDHHSKEIGVREKIARGIVAESFLLPAGHFAPDAPAKPVIFEFGPAIEGLNRPLLLR
jgi:hypothetical protein